MKDTFKNRPKVLKNVLTDKQIQLNKGLTGLLKEKKIRTMEQNDYLKL